MAGGFASSTGVRQLMNQTAVLSPDCCESEHSSKNLPLRSERTEGFFRAHAALLAILVVSVILRVALALAGGQLFIVDEGRYWRATLLGEWLLAGKSLPLFFEQSADHTGFVFVSAIPSMLQHGLHNFWGLPLLETMWIPGVFLSLFSVACIAMTYLLALANGSSKRESVTAALLVACSNSLFYMSRHLVPYYSGLFFILLGMYLGWKRRDRKRAFLTGILMGFGFLDYNALWPVALTALFIHAGNHACSKKEFFSRLKPAVAGFFAPLAVLEIYCWTIGRNYLGGIKQLYRAEIFFSVRNGACREGWSMPVEYFWQVEHGILILWLAAIVLLSFKLISQKTTEQQNRARVWLAAVTAIYAVLTFASVGLGKFFICGRHIEPMVPFLCLLAANVLESYRLNSQKYCAFVGVLLAIVCAQAAINFIPAYALTFPLEFEKKAKAAYRIDRRSDVLADSDVMQGSPYRNGTHLLLNVSNHFYKQEHVRPIPPGKTLVHAPHPLQYVPYQYLGYPPDERQLLRKADISMRLIEVNSDDGSPKSLTASKR